MKVYISPSNQYGNMYAWGGTNEMEQCNRIAEAVERNLLRNGYEVKRAKKMQDMNYSIAESNAWGADLHIPIHTNAGGGRGPLVMVYAIRDSIVKYASPIYNELKNIAPKGGGYGVRIGSDMTGGHWMPAELANTDAIAVYCECDFHDDAQIAEWIVKNVSKIGDAIARGVCKGDGKPYKEDGPEPEPPKPDPKPTGEVKEGSVVKLLQGAQYTTGKAIPEVILAELWIVDKVTDSKALINKSVSGKWAINSWVYKKYVELVDNPDLEPEFKPYIVRTTAQVLNVRKGPGTDREIVSQIIGSGCFTIVAEADGEGASKWGKLKSGAGWISLDYADKISNV